MGEEDISEEFRLKNVEKIKNDFVKKKDQNKLMSRKEDKVYTSLNYIEHFLILASANTGHVSISAFASLFGIPAVMTSPPVELKIYGITAAIKKY